MNLNKLIPNFADLSEKQLRNWVADMPEPYASQARAELVKRGCAI